MTRKEAREILWTVWGSEGTLSGAHVQLIERVELPGETALATVARVAGVSLDGVRLFDPHSVRGALARASL